MNKKEYKEILKAIDGSIQKWKNIVYHGGVDAGSGNCPLCHLFYKDNCEKDTLLCPIYEKTKESDCCFPQYNKWLSIPLTKSHIYSVKNKRTQDAANHMLSFMYGTRLWWMNKYH